jgi:hypothetical protein
MLNKIVSLFQREQIKPITLQRSSRIPVVILRDSSIRTERAVRVYGRMA